MYYEKALVTTTKFFVKEGNNYTGTKHNVVKDAINTPTAKNKIDRVNKTEKSQASNKKVDTSNRNKYDKGKSLNKSRSNIRTETENTFNKENKSRSISTTSLSEKEPN